MNPEHLIFSHLPLIPEWQLLQEAIPPNDITSMVSPSVLSLCLGVCPLLWAKCITINEDSITTTVKIPINTPSNVQLSVKLCQRNDHQAIAPSVTQSQLQTTFIEKCNGNQLAQIFCSVPGKGIFSLDIHARKNHNNVFCFSYMIHCMSKPAVCTGFPTVYDLPSQAFQFKPLYWNTPQPANSCENDQGKMDIVFECKAGLYFYHCLLPGINTGSEHLINNFDAQYYSTSITSDTFNQSLHKMSVIFPARGWWTVCLCASRKNHDVECSGYIALLSYPVYAKEIMSNCSYPHVQSSDIRFELDESISCDGTDILVIPFFSAKNLQFYSCLCYEDIEAHQEKQFTRIETLEGFTKSNEYKYTLNVVFPKPGKWYIRVFCYSEEHLLSEGFPSLFNILITVNGCINNAVFPIMEDLVVRKCSICLMHRNSLITIGKNDKMFSLKFNAPKTIKLDHYIEPQSASENSDPLDSVFHRCYTYLRLIAQNSTQNIYELTAIFPRAGRWHIVLCAGESSFSTLKVALRVPVDNTKSMLQELKIFPLVYSALKEFGVMFPSDYPLYSRHTDSPEFDFVFLSEKSISFSWNLKNVLSNKQTPHSNNVYIESGSKEGGEKEVHRLRIIFPKPGIWLVQVVARTILTDIVADNSLSLSLHYQPVFDLIVETSNASLSGMAFPVLHVPFYSTFGLRIKANDVPLPAKFTQLPATCTIKFYSPPGVLFWHQCNESSQLQGKKITRMSSYPETGLHELCVNISKRGQWTVYLHAKLATDSSNNWTTVLQHVIFVNKTCKSHSSSSLSTIMT